MHRVPNHRLPDYSDLARENSLFHYTTADGLLGILQNKELWSTAHYCANDVSELTVGKGILTPYFRKETYRLIDESHSHVDTFRTRGVDIKDYADQFETLIYNLALSFFNVYISCFCKPSGREDFLHGLLSQWRGYGVDGGYALQFNREVLQSHVDEMKKNSEVSCELEDVHYTPDNSLKKEVDNHAEAFVAAYLKHLDWIAKGNFTDPIKSPLANLTDGPLEAYIDYFIHTKSGHFEEEKECRLSILLEIPPKFSNLDVDYFNRNGLIVPFVRSPQEFNVLDCIDWIVVGPGPRIENRYKSVVQMVKNLELNIQVRPSHIPFVRI